MSQLITGVMNFLGIETRLQEAVWRTRTVLLKNSTIYVNYFDRGFQSQIKTEMELLRTHAPNATDHVLEMYAEARVRLGALCAAKCALPREGVTAAELRGMGLQTGLHERFVGILRVVGFPEGWDMNMEPIYSETPLASTPYATVTDEAGTPRLSVFYLDSAGGDTLRGSTTTVG